jgi:RimJ/RimL family protein N-acetyltransferase
MIETDRLILRPFEMSDLDDYAALNADPKVMRFYPMLYSRERSLESLESCRASWDTHGYGFSAVTDKDGVFLGLCGLSMFTAEAPFTPKVEIGWRFVPSAWGVCQRSGAGLVGICVQREGLRRYCVLHGRAK